MSATSEQVLAVAAEADDDVGPVHKKTNGKMTVGVDVDVNYDDGDAAAAQQSAEGKPPGGGADGAVLISVVSAEAKVEEEGTEESSSSSDGRLPSEGPSCETSASSSAIMVSDGGSNDIITSGSDEAEASAKRAENRPEEKVHDDDDDNVDDSICSIATQLHANDKLLEAARLLRTLDHDALTPAQRAILSKARSVDALVQSLQSTPDAKHGWTTLGEDHSHGRDTRIYYRMDHPPPKKSGGDGNNPTLNVRVQTPIDASLLVPLISVLNESELYRSWIPSFSVPRFGVRTVTKLSQMGRCSQVLQVAMDSPWPLAPREVVLRALAVDDIDANRHIVVQMESLEAGDEGGLVPEAVGRVKRMDFKGGFLIRKCPPPKEGRINKSNNKLLVSFCMQVEDAMTAVPQWLLNFLVKTVIAMSWNMLLNVAEEVRDGERPMHAEAIEEKRDRLYDWVDVRVGEMLSSTTTINYVLVADD